LKQDYRRYWGSTVSFAGRGEMISNDDCYCEIDGSALDRWGIPVLRFHWRWSDYERNQARHMQETFRAIIQEMGGEPLGAMPSREDDYGLMTGGSIIHEVGTTRMGSSARDSVVNGWCQAHDLPNLFIADGGPFVTQSDKNPTWTILALSMRTSDYIAEQMRTRAL
jgi:choline dehydrogenase-like flavoprotein